MVHNWLMHAISPSIARSVDALELASDVWKDLREKFSRGDMVRIAELMQEFDAFKQCSLSVTEYHTGLKAFWEELENYRPIPSCTCPARCSCEAMRNARQFKQQEYVIKFLNGLDEQYSQVKLQILQTDPFPSMNQVFSKILQHERSITGPAQFQDESKILVNAATGNNSRVYGRGRGFNSNKVCTHCGKVGHTIEVCYRKHGFPPHFKFRNGPIAQNIFQDENSDMKPVEEDTAPRGEGSQQPVSGLNQEQYKTLVTLLQQANLQKQTSETPSQVSASQISAIPQPDPGNNLVLSCFSSVPPNAWIFDSGATDHICSSLVYFSTYTQIKPIHVKLPNSQTVLA